MKIAVLGGTGDMGSAIAGRLSRSHGVIIGSRDPEKAKAAASKMAGASGDSYEGASSLCEAAILAVPYEAMGVASSLAEPLAGKLVVSVINPLKFEGGALRYGLETGSAAEQLARMLPDSGVATAFNGIPFGMLHGEDELHADVLVASTSREAFEQAASLVRSVPSLKPLYAGPIVEAQAVERMTPLLLNLARWNRSPALTTRFVPMS